MQKTNSKKLGLHVPSCTWVRQEAKTTDAIVCDYMCQISIQQHQQAAPHIYLHFYTKFNLKIVM